MLHSTHCDTRCGGTGFPHIPTKWHFKEPTSPLSWNSILFWHGLPDIASDAISPIIQKLTKLFYLGASPKTKLWPVRLTHRLYIGNSQSLFLGPINLQGWLTSQGKVTYTHLFIIKDITVDKSENLEKMYVQGKCGKRGGACSPDWPFRLNF